MAISIRRLRQMYLRIPWIHSIESSYQSRADFPPGSAPPGAINEAANTFVSSAGYPQTIEVPVGMDVTISGACGQSYDNTTGDISVRVQVNGVTVADNREEMKDAAGVDPDNAAVGTNQKHAWAFLSGAVTLPAGSTTVDFQFTGSQSGPEASIWRANVLVREIVQ